MPRLPQVVANPYLIGRALDYLCEGCQDNVYALGEHGPSSKVSHVKMTRRSRGSPACEVNQSRRINNLDSASMSFFVLTDCEWRPNLAKGERNKVALLTIATPDRAVLIRLCRMRLKGGVLPDVLMDFFEDGGNYFLGNGWNSDSSALEYSFDTPKEVRPFFLVQLHI